VRKHKTVLLALFGGGLSAAIVIAAFYVWWTGSRFPSTAHAITTHISAPLRSTRTETPSPLVSEATSASSVSTTVATVASTTPQVPTPSPTADTPWTKAFVPTAGLTVMFPSTWVLNSAGKAGQLTQILSWTPVGPGGMDGVPRGGLLIQISVSNDSAPANGEPVKVGDKGYAGVMTTGDLSDPDPFWDPKLIRRVYYRAEGTNWLIQGYFGDEVSDGNRNFPIFMRIVQSIAHVNAPAPTPTPVPTPTPTPVPQPTPTPVQLPYEYLHPDIAFREAEQQLGIQQINQAFISECADILPFLFHLASANVGQFNTDPNQFYPWLVDWISEIEGKSTPSEDWQTHMFRQVDAVFHQPDCQAAKVLRAITADGDNSGYWYYVLWPTNFLRQDDLGLRLMKSQFESIRTEYIVDTMLRASPPTTLAFDAYFANSGYLEKWMPPLSP